MFGGWGGGCHGSVVSCFSFSHSRNSSKYSNVNVMLYSIKKKIDTLGMYTASPAGSFGVISYPCVGFVHTSS